MKFDVIVIGGGKSGFAEAMKAAEGGRSCALISEGRSLDRIRYEEFTEAGGCLMLGDSVVEAVFCDKNDSGHEDTCDVQSIKTRNLEGITLEADSYILATGRFCSRGLYADMDSVRETVMNLDLDFDSDRTKWFDDDFWAEQPFAGKGVVADKDGHPYRNGRKVGNVLVVGSILSKTTK